MIKSKNDYKKLQDVFNSFEIIKSIDLNSDIIDYHFDSNKPPKEYEFFISEINNLYAEHLFIDDPSDVNYFFNMPHVKCELFNSKTKDIQLKEEIEKFITVIQSCDSHLLHQLSGHVLTTNFLKFKKKNMIWDKVFFMDVLKLKYSSLNRNIIHQH